jgi:hypothetical protein
MRADVESGPGGLRLPPEQVRNKRLELATDMLALTLKEVGLLPVKQQEQVRAAMRNLTDVQQWCQRHQGS